MTGMVESRNESLPLVPLRDMVVFPHMMAPFIVGRESSVHALEAALATPGRHIFLVAQRDPKVDEPLGDDLYSTGVVARVVQNLRLPNGNIKVMVEGSERGRLLRIEERGGTSWADVEVVTAHYPSDEKVQLFVNKVLATFEQYAKLSQHLAFEGLLPTLKLDDPDRFADTLAAHLAVTTADKQGLLELVSPFERLQRLEDLLEVPDPRRGLCVDRDAAQRRVECGHAGQGQPAHGIV